MSSVTNPVLNEGLQDVINLLQGIGTDLNETVGLSVIGVAGTATAPVDAITAPGNGYLLGTDGDELVFTQLTGSMIPSDIISNGMLRNSSALSVIGRSANSTGDPADIGAATDNQVLRRSGTSIGFGAINLASSDAITGDLPDANLSANVPLLNAANAFTNTMSVTGLVTLTASNGAVLLSSAIPRINFTETDAASNNQAWSVLANSERFVMQTNDGTPAEFLAVERTAGAVDSITLTGANIDVMTAGTPSEFSTTSAVFRVAKAGTTFGIFRDTTNNVELQVGAFSAGAFVGSLSNHDLQLYTNNTERARILTDGSMQFFTATGNSAPAISIRNAAPTMHWYETDGATDNKIWAMNVRSEQLQGLVINDANSVANLWLTVDRTDATVDSVALSGTAIALNGATTITSNAANPLVISCNVENTQSLVLDNDNTGNSSVRLALASGDSSSALFTAGTGRSSAIVTGGPTGAQTVLRNLGAYPLIFGTDNTVRARISQEIAIADDATATFPVNSGIIAISSSFGVNATAIICVFQNSEQVSIYAGPNTSVGNGSNPNVDGNMNVWKSAAGTLSIKNRLGSTRAFYVTTMSEY